MSDIRIIVDNTIAEPYKAEHGLSLAVFHRKERILFDTGAGAAIRHNLACAALTPRDFTKLVLSHGHYDHSGGIAEILPEMTDAEIYLAPGADIPRFSRHEGRGVRDLSMRQDAKDLLADHAHLHQVKTFTEIADGVFLTGPIPRITSEDTGGPFFLDKSGNLPDTIADEQAMLLDSGILIQGCCHAGIINTLEYCRICAPQIHIHTIIGGLHLLHASEERLKQTADHLQAQGLKKLLPLHCTGENAVAYLKKRLGCGIVAS